MTLVVDASVVAEVLLGTRRGKEAATSMGEQALVAPHHLTAEVLSVIRGWTLGGHLSHERALVALNEYGELGVELIDSTELLPDAFALRHNLTAYDASYVVLARALNCPLLTLDERIVKAAPDYAASGLPK